MDDISLAYIAGFFDGEGSMSIVPRSRKEWNTEYRLWVAIGQKDGETLDFIKENFGGNVYLVKRDGSFYWAISNKNAYNFIKTIYPFLRYKKPQAEIALRFYDEAPNLKRPIPKEELERRETLNQKMRELKHVVVKSQYAGSTTKRTDPKGM